ncbi:MAG: radical SAM protein [Desulfobacterales bacterium]|nr:radical SAM protein [Desulfobacterales bacterium]
MSLKVALIAPPYPLEEAPSPPLGLCYVASAFRKAGATVKIYDFIVSEYTKEKLSKELLSFEPDIIGTTSVTMNFFSAIDILCVAKKISPSAVTIMGGPHASFDSKNILKKYTELDLIFSGEADITIPEFYNSFNEKSDWKSVKGLIFRENNNIIDTGKRDYIEDLDSLSIPARDLLPISKYQALGYPVSIITSRGCPGRCIFCLGRKMTGQKVRKRSVTKVVDEIESILNLGFEFINIADDLFTADRKRVIEICNEIEKRELKFSFSVFSRVNTIDYELLMAMKKAGLHAISFGIESGNTDMLKRVRKGITLNQARKAISNCKKADVRPHVSFMVGLPGETNETLNDTLKFQE